MKRFLCLTIAALLLIAQPAWAKLSVNQLSGFGAGGTRVVTLTFVDYTDAGTQSSPHTFSAHAIGTASADRHVVVNVAISTVTPATDVTVDGQSTTRVLTATAQGRSIATFVTDSPVTSGTTADIVVTMGSTRSVDIAVYTLEGAASPTSPDDTIQVNDDTSPSGDIDVEANGAILGFVLSENTGVSFTWTGLTEDQEGASGAYDTSYAHDEFETAQTGRTVSVSMPSEPTSGALIVLAWNP